MRRVRQVMLLANSVTHLNIVTNQAALRLKERAAKDFTALLAQAVNTKSNALLALNAKLLNLLTQIVAR